MILSLSVFGAMMQQSLIQPRVGLEITASGKVKPGEYALAQSEANVGSPVIVVRGDNLTVDFSDVVLRGTAQTVDPDERKGIAVEVFGDNVTIKGLHAHGYMHGLIARQADGLKLLDCDFSYNHKQRLKSTNEKEDTSDWMSYHANEEDEWLRFGTGVYLDDCDNFEVRNLTVVGGQNGLMMTESEGGVVWNSNLSFLSSVGLGMYRSSNNRIMHNNIDWCVRGYSHGVYNRGQDSTGILIYEQSNKNTFAYNSVTHGGDGFFLWAGQSTMDTGAGGCNDNLLYANDFSHAPTNGIEATFSRNTFANNLIMECWHGVWGGYSYDTKIVGNVFAMNAESIAIEHGQSNLIEGNVFRRETTVLKIWANETQDPNWGYPKNRDTESHYLTIRNNVFFNNPGVVFDIRRTTDVEIFDNFIKRNGMVFKLGEAVKDVKLKGNELWVQDGTLSTEGVTASDNVVKEETVAPTPAMMQPSGNIVVKDITGVSNADYLKRFDLEWSGMAKIAASTKTPAQMSPEELRQTAAAPYYVAPLAGGNDPFLKEGTLRGRRFILIDEWGPYDFKSPRMVLRSKEGGKLRFEILGPPGEWTLKTASANVGVTARTGKVPGFLDAEVSVGGNFEIGLEYVGAQTTDYRGIVTPAGRPVAFGFSEFRIPIDWTVKFWNYNLESQDPRTKQEAFSAVLRTEPAATLKLSELVQSWGGSPAEGVNSDYFATIAEGKLTLPEGNYVIDLTSDDGVRLSLDGKVIFEDWTYHAPKSEAISVRMGGQHTLKVEHFELNGFSTLQLKIRKAEP